MHIIASNTEGEVNDKEHTGIVMSIRLMRKICKINDNKSNDLEWRIMK
jgi:hypothetical protein